MSLMIPRVFHFSTRVRRDEALRHSSRPTSSDLDNNFSDSKRLDNSDDWTEIIDIEEKKSTPKKHASDDFEVLKVGSERVRSACSSRQGQTGHASFMCVILVLLFCEKAIVPHHVPTGNQGGPLRATQNDLCLGSGGRSGGQRRLHGSNFHIIKPTHLTSCNACGAKTRPSFTQSISYLQNALNSPKNKVSRGRQFDADFR